MKYHDSLKKAKKIMALSIEQLERWQLPITPINYAVTYVFISQNNTALNTAIDEHNHSQLPFDNFLIEELYKTHILGQSKLRDGIVNELDDVLKNISISCQQSCASSKLFIQKLDEHFLNKPETDIASVNTLVKQLKTLTTNLKTTQQTLIEQLSQSQETNRNLRVELKAVRKEIELDPVTGLYTRQAMSKHIERWHKEDPNKEIAVIVININQLSDYNNKFGSLLSDVILSKIANKISSYVNNSGIPVRTGGDEFLVLIPEIDEPIAKEIADKISLGVEKLRFVSVQTGVKLPKMTVSLGITSKFYGETITDSIERARNNIQEFE